ncbi:MAG: hypothetical protein ACXVSF_21220, partial [Solirubrobacteraceae bacterium]
MAPITRSTSVRTDRSPSPVWFSGEVAPRPHRDRQVRPADRSLDVSSGERHTPISLADLHGAL